MKVKASLHIHSNADLTEGEAIGYSVFELIDTAERAGIKVLAHTCHQYFVWDEAWRTYAEQKGILLIPGVELSIEDGSDICHVVAINVDSSIDRVISFADLIQYRLSHPDMLVIAAHPNFGMGASMGMARLERYGSLFDAVENSWFYCRLINLNQPAKLWAQRNHKPYIATADLHNFNFFCLATDYAVLTVPELGVKAVVEAVKRGRFTNVSKPKSVWAMIRFVWLALVWIKLSKLTKWMKGGINT